MIKVLEIARVTTLQLIRDRILHLSVIFFFLLLGLNLLFSELSIAEKQRIYVNFGLSLLHITMIVISITLGVLAFRREVESRSLDTLLVRPLTRTQFVMGHFLGLGAIILLLVSMFSSMLYLIFLWSSDSSFFLLYLLAVAGIFIESLFILGFSHFLAITMSYPVAMGLSVGVVVLGHWMSSFRFFINRSESGAYKWVGEFVYWMTPHLERVNFRYWPILPLEYSGGEALWGCIQILSYCAFSVLLACLAFEVRELDR